MSACPRCAREHPAGADCATGPTDPRPLASQRAIATEVPPEPEDPDGKQGLAIGTQVGDWIVARKLGKGGMGAVYEARHKTTHVPVAIKILLPPENPKADDEAKRRFASEAQVPTLIGVHPNIIQVFTFGVVKDNGPWNGRPWFAMEYLQGRSLDKRLAVGAPPPLDELRRLFSQVCDALATVHDKRVVHRDLKPGNIFIAEPKHGESVAKLLDFGIAKIPSNALTQMGAQLGTLEYAAPEQFSPGKLARYVDINPVVEAGPETDIFGLGSVLFEVFTGRVPYGFAFVDLPNELPTREGYPKIGPALERLIRDCLQKRKENRPSSIKDVKRRLLEALTEMAAGAATAAGIGPLASGGMAPSSASVAGSRVAGVFSVSGGSTGSAGVSVAVRAILSAPRRRVYLALAGALVLALAVGIFAVWGRSGGDVKIPRASGTEAITPTPTAASPATPVPSPAPIAAAPVPARAPSDLGTRAARRIPRPASAALSPAWPPSSPHPVVTGLQPGPPPAAPALAPSSVADRGQPAPSPPSPSPPNRVAAPEVEAHKPSRQLTPSERDLITDKNILFR